MTHKIVKMIRKTGGWHFVFVFLAVFLSLFSYILGNNIVFGVKSFLQEELKPLVGGDIVLSSRVDIDEAALHSSYGEVFEIAKTISLDSNLFDEDNHPQLIELVYHSDNYPFYNQFSYDTLNPDGVIVVDQGIYDTYGDIIEVLGEPFLVKGIITQSLMGDINVYASQHTIYLPLGVFDTSLNATNSRLQFEYYLKSIGPYDQKYSEILKSDPLLSEVRITTLQDRNSFISDMTDRLYVFINFFYLVVFVLAFLIVMIALESFFKKLQPTFGLLQIFGLIKGKIFGYSLVLLGGIFLSGFVLAYLLNFGVIQVLQSYYDFFQTDSRVVYKGLGVMLVLLGVGVSSPFYSIYSASIGRLLKDEGSFSHFTLKDYAIYLGCIFGGFLGVSVISGLGWGVSVGYSVGGVALIVILYILIEKVLQGGFAFLKKTSLLKKNFYIFDAIRSTIKPGNVSFLIVFSAIVSCIAIFVFIAFSGSFLHYLSTITGDSRDRFIINVQGQDIPALRAYFSEDEIYEIVSLKLLSINGKSLQQHLGVEQVPMQFGREFSSTTHLLDNAILSGVPLTSGGVSVDRDFAKDLGLKLGDSIVFGVAGLDITLEVVNFREAVRHGANPFFFFQLMESDFEAFPKNYMISYDSKEKPDRLESIVATEIGGHMTFINVSDILEIVIGIAKQILKVVYVCLAYIGIFSVLSFVVSFGFLSNFKHAKVHLLSLLGGEKRLLWRAVSVEFIYLLFIGVILSILIGSVLLGGIFYSMVYFSLYIPAFLWSLMVIVGLFVGVCVGAWYRYTEPKRKFIF